MGHGESGARCWLRHKERGTNVQQHINVHCPWCLGATFSTPSGGAELCKHVEGRPGVEACVMSLHDKRQGGWRWQE